MYYGWNRTSCLLKTLRTIARCSDETAPVIYERHYRARAMKLPLSIKRPCSKTLSQRPRQVSMKDPAITIKPHRTLQQPLMMRPRQLSIEDPGHALKEALSSLLTALAIVLSYTYVTIKSI